MKYLNLCQEKSVELCLIIAVMLITAVSGYSQCSLSCNGTTQVSLSSTCNAIITPNMILSDNGISCMGGSLSVVVSDDYGPMPGGNEVTSEYMGQTLTAMVIDATSGNSCWGNIIIEDKLGPAITDCPMGFITMDCPDMTTYSGPTFTDNCDGDLTAVLLTEDITTPCDPGIIKEIVQTYSAVDNKGNVATNQCTVRLRLNRFSCDRVTYPDSLLISDNTALSCAVVSDYDANGNGRIDEGELTPAEFGVPFYTLEPEPGVFDTVLLYPYPDIYCNTVVTFEDIVLPKIGCTQKIMRRWLINEWHCDGENSCNYTQLIEITDNEGPEVTCQPTLELTTNTLIAAPGGTYGDFNCGAEVSLPLPEGTDNCSEDIKYDVTYPTGHINDYDGGKITLPMGTNVVLFTVYDDCYNSSTCHIALNIVDNTPPIAICDQNTTVSLTSGGTATVRSESFDDGSYDDCKMHCSLVRRMDNGTCVCRVPEFCDLTYLGNRNGSNYYLSNYKIAASIAKNRATSYGGGLVTFEDEDEESWLTGEVRKRWSDRFWIGIKRQGDAFLNEDHTALEYTNWATDQPSLGIGEDCVMVTPNNQWNDAPCSSEQRYVLEIAEGCGFSSGAKFCCEDAGAEHMVVLRVVDFYGNFNDCMVSLTVQDKSAPRLTCPSNMTVDCDHLYDRNDLDSAFGSLEIGESCGSNIFPSVDIDFDECGSGTITRLWNAHATDDINSQIVSHCKQIITFENNNPFDGDEIICPVQDTTITGCDIPGNFGPEVMGTPTYLAGVCDRIGVDFDDRLFNFNNNNGDACFKIIRTWDIIDWCQIDPLTNSNRTWSCHQVIKVSNSIRPVISGDKAVNICSYDASCSQADVELEVWGEDDCTEAANLKWSYSVFLGSIDSAPNLSATPDSTVTGTGDHVVASGKYPLGSHIIRWTFFDGCGNAATSDQPFTVTNCKAATAYCINGLAVELMPIDEEEDGIIDFGMIELWASDFDAGSYHPCGYPVQLSFSADVTDTNKTFDCLTRGNQIVEIWATVTTPTGEQVQTYCTTFVDIQDNMNACQGQRMVNVDGQITTEESKTVENIEVVLEGSPMEAMTNDSGEYAFPNMAPGGDYVINPYSNHDVLNGVSTLDLISIQRHILGLELLDSPYKQIAADIDNNKTINGVDLVELRKLILGLYTELPANDSWRFVDKGYAFNNVENPLGESFTEDYEIQSLNADMNVDFVAVKVGDVNNSAIVEIEAGKRVSSTNNTTVIVGDVTGSAGEMITVPVALNQGNDILGYQLGLEVSKDLEILEVTSTQANFDQSNYVVNEDNSIVISYGNESAIAGDRLFEVVAIIKNQELSTSPITISDRRIKSEIYSIDKDILTPIMENNQSSALSVTQNTPNPFNESTSVLVQLDDASTVNITITDVHGKIVSVVERELNKGSHNLVVSEKQLGAAGIYYLSVQTNKANQTIKMVLID